MRKTEFANGECYHIYNRGVEKRQVFANGKDYERFFISIALVNDEKGGWLEVWRNLPDEEKIIKDFRRLNLRKPIVDVIAFCFNPNHYHFILKQLENKGIEKFMQRLGTAYTMYFNAKYKRSGALFQGRFKSIHIDSNEYLLYLSAYVNKNYSIHGLGDSNEKYSSLNEYKHFPEVQPPESICRPAIVLEQFKNVNEYLNFVDINALYLKNKKEEQRYLLEN